MIYLWQWQLHWVTMVNQWWLLGEMNMSSFIRSKYHKQHANMNINLLSVLEFSKWCIPSRFKSFSISRQTICCILCWSMMRFEVFSHPTGMKAASQNELFIWTIDWSVPIFLPTPNGLEHNKSSTVSGSKIWLWGWVKTCSGYHMGNQEP